MTDEEIDYSDIPPLTDQFFENATLRIPATQETQKLGFLSHSQKPGFFSTPSPETRNRVSVIPLNLRHFQNSLLQRCG
uniref:Uncharacterized protein n=1 Tax=Planktothricoides sp. SpSt-374 TaxID=2282167 RepID=A0A7C3ZIH3_9CYAN